MTEHTLHVLLRDNPGALHRAVTLFRRRGYNIRSLHVDRAEAAGVSRMDVCFEASSATQLAKELERFVDVLSVRNVTRSPVTALVSTTIRTQADGICDEEIPA
jgi:acetolactate synthase-1/3 small subunit